jgi:hypothetical protein
LPQYLLGDAASQGIKDAFMPCSCHHHEIWGMGSSRLDDRLNHISLPMLLVPGAVWNLRELTCGHVHGISNMKKTQLYGLTHGRGDPGSIFDHREWTRLVINGEQDTAYGHLARLQRDETLSLCRYKQGFGSRLLRDALRDRRLHEPGHTLPTFRGQHD